MSDKEENILDGLKKWKEELALFCCSKYKELKQYKKSTSSRQYDLYFLRLRPPTFSLD